MTKPVEALRVGLRRLLLPAWALLAIGGAVTPAAAESSLPTPAPSYIEQGQALARAWCAGCHQVELGGKAPFAEVPSFTAVARMPSTTGSALRAFLSTPHAKMPQLKLKAGELDAVIAYVLSLKNN
jgi:cytochrome c